MFFSNLGIDTADGFEEYEDSQGSCFPLVFSCDTLLPTVPIEAVMKEAQTMCSESLAMMLLFPLIEVFFLFSCRIGSGNSSHQIMQVNFACIYIQGYPICVFSILFIVLTLI